jgi:hypothetical protein
MMSSCRWIGCLALLGVVTARGLAAQATAPHSTPRLFPAEPDVSAPIFAGAGLGMVGFGVGGLVGYSAFSNHCSHAFDDFCGLEEFFLGAAVGGTFGMAVGVHLGNRRRGSLAKDFLAGALVWGAGIGYLAATRWDSEFSTIVLFTNPLLQLGLTTSVERSEGRKRERSQSLKVALVPRPHGLGFAASLPLPRIR